MAIDKEILDGFTEETNTLLKEVKDIAEQLESVESGAAATSPLQEFAIRIDRIMGAARTIATMDPNHVGLKKIGNIAQLCKGIGYKAADKKIDALVPLIAAFYLDSIECIEALMSVLSDDNQKSTEVFDSFYAVLHKRLELLEKHLK